MHRTAHEPIDKMACSPKLIWFFLSINTLPTNTSNIFDIKKKHNLQKCEVNVGIKLQ